MIIRRAILKGLHGHINQNLKFKPGVNVIIGTNGSGKTTVLNAIAWTLSPSLSQGGAIGAYLLSRLDFSTIDIRYVNTRNEKQTRVLAIRMADKITISVTGVNGELEIPLSEEPRRTRIAGVDAPDPDDFVSASLEHQRNNEVLIHLNSLNGPLYLPLDRRWLEPREARFRTTRQRRMSTSYQSSGPGSLHIGYVLSMAERANTIEQSAINELNAKLRNDILASLFESSGNPAISNVKVWTVEEVNQNRQRIVSTLENLGVQNASESTKDYFSNAERISKEIGGLRLGTRTMKDSESRYWSEWIFGIAPLAGRAESLARLIEKHDANQLVARKATISFLDSVNSYFADSGKSLEFSESGDLIVVLPGGRETSAANLSSGELQFLTLFTFLYFQFDQDQQFTIIIDEPELSLHPEWQNRYLDSITKANPSAQFIIATHSPEIAAPYEDRTEDISPTMIDA